MTGPGAVIRIHTLGGLSVRGDDGKPVAGAAAQPRRVSILALLARAGDRGISREKVLSLLWPDAADETGPRTLTQALYALRKDLGAEDAITGAKELRFDPARVSTDVSEFTSAVARGDDARAAALYQGPFLDGFHLSGADEFTRWMEKERAALAHDHARVLESLARAALARGQAEDSVAWWRKLAALDPLNARVTVGLMGALVAAGDRAGALRHAHVYEVLLEQELDLPPDREVMALAAKLRQGSDGPPVAAVDANPFGVPVAAGLVSAPSLAAEAPGAADLAAQDAAPGQPEDVGTAVVEVHADPSGPQRADVRRRPTRWAAAAILSAAVVAVAAFSVRGLMSARASTAGEGVVVAVGRIASYGADSATRAMADPVADLLATSLARVPGLHVVSQGRMLELMRPAPGDTSAGALVSAARQAGATEVVDGTLYSRPGGLLRLDLRRVDLATGAIRDVRTIEGSDLFALVDSGTAHLVSALGTRVPAGSIADVTTRSAVAYGLYVEGVRTLIRGDRPAAERLFEAALREDTTFAMAAYYHGRVAQQRAVLVSRLARALRLSARATDRERLVIRAGWAWLVTAPELGALAESLVTRYPQETEGYLYTGVAKVQEGAFLAAIPPLKRAVAMDTLAFTRTDGAWGCNSCAALTWMVGAYELADSLGAAEREARRYVRLQPALPGAWIALWDVLERAGRFTEAQQVAERIAALDGDAVAVADRAAYHAIRMGDFVAADRMLRAGIQAGNASARRSALWALVISLRYQGRMTEALEAARVFRATDEGGAATMPGAVSFEARPLGIALFESGRYRESAALFDSMALWRTSDEAESGAARDRAWGLTQAARARAALGDTAVLAVRADTIEAYGALSGSGRDQRLHSYVRGLLLRARGDLTGAERSFRAAMYSVTAGYTCANAELARVLLRRGRPREAVAVLSPALRGKLDASNFYITHTELHELLAQAWDAAGVRDSAATHYAMVARAWSAGDPPYRARADSARARAAALRVH